MKQPLDDRTPAERRMESTLIRDLRAAVLVSSIRDSIAEETGDRPKLFIIDGSPVMDQINPLDTTGAAVQRGDGIVDVLLV